jgi:hypothetical protein
MALAGNLRRKNKVEKLQIGGTDVLRPLKRKVGQALSST